MDCQNVGEATRMATELYREVIAVPFMSRFIVYGKRHDVAEAKLRVYCITDDKEEKILETRENFTILAKSKEVEVLENRIQWLEMGGTIAPVSTKPGSTSTTVQPDQLHMNFLAFYENRLPFSVRIKDENGSGVRGTDQPAGRLVFLKDPRNASVKSDVRLPPVCTLDIHLPAYSREALEYDEMIKKRSTLERGGLSRSQGTSRSNNTLETQRELAHHGGSNSSGLTTGQTHVDFNLRLLANDLTNMLIFDHQHSSPAAGSSASPQHHSATTFDWLQLAHRLELTSDEIDQLRSSSSSSPHLMSASPANQCYDMLVYWTHKYGRDLSVLNNPEAPPTGDVLLRALRDLNVEEDVIARNMIVANSMLLSPQIHYQLNSTNSSQITEHILNAEKSLAKMRLHATTGESTHSSLTHHQREPQSSEMSYEERDMTKESESAEVSDSEDSRIKQTPLHSIQQQQPHQTTIVQIEENTQVHNIGDATQIAAFTTTTTITSTLIETAQQQSSEPTTPQEHQQEQDKRLSTDEEAANDAQGSN
jgi:hypothetical protein